MVTYSQTIKFNLTAIIPQPDEWISASGSHGWFIFTHFNVTEINIPA
jgi:hypothetical protein